MSELAKRYPNLYAIAQGRSVRYEEWLRVRPEARVLRIGPEAKALLEEAERLRAALADIASGLDPKAKHPYGILYKMDAQDMMRRAERALIEAAGGSHD